MTKKISILFALMVMAVMAAGAQTTPIKWRTFVKMTSETEGVLTVKAVIEPGWHLYGTKLPEGGPVATTFDFSGSHGVKYTGPFVPDTKTVTMEDPNFGMTLTYWDKTVSFTRKFKLTGPIDGAEIKGTVRYMACNDENCMPPKTENISIKPKYPKK